MKTEFIKVENAEMVFDTRKGRFHALRQIDLAVAEGEFVALIGHSGCGKSTLLNLVAGLLEPSAGVLLCDGREIAEDDLEHLRDTIWRHMIAEPWRAGDMVVIDNFAVSHGRLPYHGPRQVVVAWA